MKIHLLGIGSETLLSDLDSAGVKFSRNHPPHGEVMNSGSSIEIATHATDAVPWVAIASVLVAWLRARASRKVILTLDDKKVFYAEGLSVREVQRLLGRTSSVNAFDTKKPEGEQITSTTGLPTPSHGELLLDMISVVPRLLPERSLLHPIVVRLLLSPA